LPKIVKPLADTKRDDIFFRYEIMQCEDVEKLIKRRQDPEESPVYYVSIEDTFEVIKRVHLATRHGGRDRMTKEINKKYANITREALELFKSFCEECQKKTEATQDEKCGCEADSDQRIRIPGSGGLD